MRSVRLVGILGSLAGFAAVPVALAQVLAVGTEFQVNSYSSGTQAIAAIAADGNGRFAVVWTSNFSSVWGRRFAADGTPLGVDFQVNTYSASNQGRPAIAMGEAGEFVVVWNSWGSPGTDTSESSIQARRFDSSGAALGAQFQVNTDTTSSQQRPSVAKFGDEGFVVVWENTGSIGSIQGQRFNASGGPLGEQFQINQAGAIRAPRVAARETGDFVVVWENFLLDTIAGRLFDADGTPLGNEFPVAEGSGGMHPAVALNGAGEFVVAWATYSGEYMSTVSSRRFDFTGSPLGGSSQVSSPGSAYMMAPAVIEEGEGDFVVAWTTTGYDILARTFGPDGSPLGREFRIPTQTTGLGVSPALCLNSDDEFLVTWTQQGDIAARRFQLPFFIDAFESGNSARWTVSTP